MQMSYLYEPDFPFNNFANSLNMQKLYEKMFEKRVITRTRWRYEYRPRSINHISIFFFTTISTSKKINFPERELEKGLAWHIDARRVVWTLIDNGKLVIQIARLAAIVVKYYFYYYFSFIFSCT